MKIALLAGWISRFSNRTLLCLLLAVLVVLSAASSLNKGPWSDEGHFASAAYNLAVHGFMGTTVLPEPNSPAFQGIGKHTYWIMPLSLVHQAAWFKLFGFSLFIMRSVSIFYGVAAVAACFYLLLSLTRNRWAALLGAGLIATDYAFVMGASLGRPDMMCAAFGFGGIACYLHWREQQLTKAIVLSQTLIVLSGMSHFNGILYFAGLLFLSLAMDRRRIRLQQVAMAALPYVVGAAAWSLYILQSPQDFAAQFFGNAMMGGRMSALRDPLGAIGLEWRERYLTGFGLGPHSAGSTGPVYLKAIALVAYVGAAITAAVVPSVRRLPGSGYLLGMTAIFVMLLTVVDGQKLTLYLVHVVPLYAMLVAVVLCWFAGLARPAVWLAAVAIAVLVGLGAGGVLLRVRQDPFHKRFLPAADAAARLTANGGFVMASSQYAFRLGYEGKILDDPYLGYFSKRTPDLVIVEELWELAFQDIAQKNPAARQHIRDLLSRYKVVYNEAGVVIYARPSGEL